MRIRFIWPLLIFLFLLGFFVFGLRLNPHELPAALLNKPVPNVNHVFDNYINVVHVWASWCESCQQDHEFLTTLNKTDDFRLVGVNYKDIKNNADLWLNKLGDPYTVNIFDHDGSLAMNLGVYGTPTTYIIDRAGVIRYRHVGVLTKELWDADIIPEIIKLIT